VADLVAVEHALSTSRLEPYIKTAGGALAEGVALYEWNIAVSAALFEVLAHLEVGLRNAIDRQLVELVGQADWWSSSGLRLTPPAYDMISKAMAEVARRGSSGSTGHVVAALPFGFWVGLLSSGHECDYEMTLWRPALHLALPGYRGTRSALYRRLNTLRLLRNRIAHHEPIHRRHLAADHDTILTVTTWISPGYASWVSRRSRVPALLAARPTAN
jgi:hypothetical protein